jgi:4-hydroxybenzoate polyprenyltransferase
MKFKKMLSSGWWFLVAAIIFFLSGIRYSILGETMWTIIYVIIAILFWASFVFQVKYKSPKKK